MRKAIWVVAIAAICVGVACNKGAGASKQKAALEAKRTQVLAEVDKALQAWLDEMVKTLPADVKKYPKAKSPLVRWRLESFGFDWQRPVSAALAQAKGTTFEKEVQSIPEFFDAMVKFWKKEIDFKDYMAAYDKLKSECKDPMAILLADFDHTFVHVEAFYGAQDMEGDDRAIYFFRHWQVAFHFPREHSEAVSQYLARLCRQKLSQFCTTIPFEVLHFAMEKPYLGEAKRIVGEFLKAHPDCKLNRIFTEPDAFLAQLDARLAGLKDYTEDPVLPSSISKKDYVGDVILTVRPAGVEYEGRDYLDFSKGWALPDKEWAAFAKKMETVTAPLEKERGPENMEIIRADLPKDAPVSLLAGFVDTWKKLPARVITFGARRRIDGLDKGTVTGHLQFREVPLAGRKLDVEGVGKVACRPLGQSDDTEDLVKKVNVAVWVDRDGARAGAFDGGKVTGLKKVDEAGAAAHLASGVGVLAVASDLPYERFVALMDPVFFKCKDARCDPPQDLSPRVDVQVCAK
jgi:hypothetical protein